MATNESFEHRIEELRKQIQDIADTAEADLIEKNAVRLEGLNYSPPVIMAQGQFLRLDKRGLLHEVDRILALPDQEACALAPDEPAKCLDIKLQCITVLIYYYSKLVLLRRGDAEAWDEIDELYVHD